MPPLIDTSSLSLSLSLFLFLFFFLFFFFFLFLSLPSPLLPTKIDLENRLEMEQEYVSNTLQKRLARAEAEKAELERRLDEGDNNLLDRLREVVGRLQQAEIIGEGAGGVHGVHGGGSSESGDSSMGSVRSSVDTSTDRAALLTQMASEIEMLGLAQKKRVVGGALSPVPVLASGGGGSGGGSGGKSSRHRRSSSRGSRGRGSSADAMVGGGGMGGGGGGGGGAGGNRGDSGVSGGEGDISDQDSLLFELEQLRDENFVLAQKFEREKERSREMARKKADMETDVELDSERCVGGSRWWAVVCVWCVGGVVYVKIMYKNPVVLVRKRGCVVFVNVSGSRNDSECGGDGEEGRGGGVSLRVRVCQCCFLFLNFLSSRPPPLFSHALAFYSVLLISGLPASPLDPSRGQWGLF
jgi:hypothetical protein